MLSAKDVTVVYETLLSSPGMSDGVKVSLQIPRRNVLMLVKAFELGLTMVESPQAGLLNIADKEALVELTVISGEILQKSGLTDMYNRLSSLQPK